MHFGKLNKGACPGTLNARWKKGVCVISLKLMVQERKSCKICLPCNFTNLKISSFSFKISKVNKSNQSKEKLGLNCYIKD